MNKITRKIQISLSGIATACGIALLSAAPSPTDYPELNDIPGDAHMMTATNVMDFVTNFVGKSVILSNGWLIVDGQAVNIMEPTKAVVVTNGGQVATNFYPAVYEDGLTNYATIVRQTITTNGEEVVTNLSPVAYLDDIPPDAAKADKVITVCDYHLEPFGVTLPRVLRADAPFTAWRYSTTNVPSYSVDLLYTNGWWDCHYSTETADTTHSQTGVLNQAIIEFPEMGGLSLTFIRTNVIEHTYVVYTDMLAAATNGIFNGLEGTFVSKTNMASLAKTITEDQLLTVNGIAGILRNLRSELVAIGGGSTMRFTVSGVTDGTTVSLGDIIPHTAGDFIVVDWGDGTEKETYVVPASTPITHTYQNPPNNTVEITIEGFIDSISGDATSDRSFIYGAMLVDVKIGSGVGLTELGDYCFFNCTGLTSLKFIPENIPKLGESCFEGCEGITSLAGMPNAVTEIPARCFAKSGIATLAGMPNGVTKIGDEAFVGSPLASLRGLPVTLQALGDDCFDDTLVTSLEGWPDSIQNLPSMTFMECQNFLLDSLSLTSITNIQDKAFAYCGISSADMSGSRIEAIADYGFLEVFGNPGAIKLPVSCTNIGVNAFNTRLQKPVVLSHADLLIGVITNLDNFPWGMSTATGDSRIEGLDGYVESKNGGWEFHSLASSLTMALPAGRNSFMLGDITSDDNVTIDWGDGSPYVSPRGLRASHIEHEYVLTEPATISVKLYGRIRSISATPSEYPFLKVKKEVHQEVNNGNPFLIGFDIGDAVGLTNIGDKAFAECQNLQGIEGMAKSITSLGDSCFTGCTSIVSIEGLAKSSITALPDRCFSGCTNIATLSSLSSMTGMRRFGKECFKNTLALKSLDGIPQSLESLGEGCFQKTINAVGGLTNINAIATTAITAISPSCFAGCSSIEGEVDISNITSIGADGLAECVNITAIDISSVSSFGDRCFRNIGAAAATQNDGFIDYKAILKSNLPFGELATVLELTEGGAENAKGISQEDTDGGVKILAKDGYELAYDRTYLRWEPLTMAVQVQLSDVPDGMRVAVVQGGTIPVSQDVAFLWNWGDGELAKSAGSSKWLTDSPAGTHTYRNSSTSNYIVTVKGLVLEIGAMPNKYPWIKMDDAHMGNPFLTGYNLPARSPIRLIGDFAFAGCTNMPAVNVLPSTRQKKTLRIRAIGNQQSRLEKLEDESTGQPLRLGIHAFDGSGVRTLSTMHDDVVALSDACFMNCKSLYSMSDMPPNILQLGGACFSGSGLTSLEGLPLNLQYISTNCFSSCYNIYTLAPGFRPSITYLGDYAFFNCTNLATLNAMGNYITDMGMGVFGQTGISSLEGFSTGMQEIPAETFRNCYSLQTTDGVTDSHILTNIGDRAFLMCTNLAEVPQMPQTVRRIGVDSFAGCIALTNASISKNISEVGAYALDIVGIATSIRTNEFGNLVYTELIADNIRCSRMEELLNRNPNTNDFVTVRCMDGDVVFRNGRWRSRLKTMEMELVNVRAGQTFSFVGEVTPTFPNAPVCIDWGVGGISPIHSGLIQSVTYPSNGTYIVRLIGFMDSIACSSEIYPLICMGTASQLSVGANPHILSVTVNGFTGLDTLGDYCFKGCNRLRYFVAPEYEVPTHIGKECFAGCISLLSLDGLPDGLASLGEGCFQGCSALQSLMGLPSSIGEIPTNCFADCTNISELDIRPSSSIQYLRSGCFRNCQKLLSLTSFPTNESVTIEDSVFENCIRLQSISNFPSSMVQIPDNCFKGCVALKSLAGMPASITEIGQYAFLGCGLTSLNGIVSPITTIGEYAFASNQNLTTWGDFKAVNDNGISLVFLEGAFSGCGNLGMGDAAFALPSNTVEVGISAFEGCYIKPLSGLPPSVRIIPERAFADTAITNLTVRDSVTNIQENAFANGIEDTWMLDGFATSRIIYFPDLSVTTITNISAFPWGAVHTTRFVGNDGFVIYHEGEWIEVRDSLTCELVVGAVNEPTIIGGFEPEDFHGVCIDWGDGNYAQWVKYGEMATNLYSYGATYGSPYKITVRRPFKRIEGLKGFDADMPFLIASAPYNYVKSISIDDASRVEIIGTNCFCNLTTMTEFPQLPDSVVEIQKRAFYQDTGLKQIASVPMHVAVLGEQAFMLESNVTSIYLNLPSLQSIPYECFYRQEHLENITFTPQSACKDVGFRAFGNCHSLKRLDLSMLSGITNINAQAFWTDPVLEELYLPSSIEDCQPFAFSNMSYNCEQKVDDDGFMYKGIIYVSGIPADVWLAKGGEETMWNSPTHLKFSAQDGDVVYSPPDRRWKINYGPMRINLSVSAGADFTFNGIDIPAGEQITIDWGDGERTNVTENITPQNPCTHHYNSANANCNISIRGFVTRIYGYSNGSDCYPFLYSANNSAAGINDIYIGNGMGLDEIGDYAFYGYSGIESFANIAAQYQRLGGWAMANCTALSSLTLPGTISSISNNAFDGCSSLRTVEVNSTDIPVLTTTSFTNLNNAVIDFPNAIGSTTQIDSHSPWGLSADSSARFWDGELINAGSAEMPNFTFSSWAISFKFKRIPYEGQAASGDFGISVPLIENLDDKTLTIETRQQNGTREVLWDANQWKTGYQRVHGIPRVTHFKITNTNQVCMIRGRFSEWDIYAYRNVFNTDANCLESVTIGPSCRMKAIGNQAFSGIEDIHLDIPTTVTRFGDGIFEGATITGYDFWPLSVSNMPARCFKNCPALSSMEGLPSCITNIGDYAFMQVGSNHDRFSLTGIPDSIKMLGLAAFQGTQITNFEALSSLSLSEIPESCFEGCGLSSLYGMPDTVTKVANRAFSCNVLQSLEGLSRNLAEIGGLDEYKVLTEVEYRKKAMIGSFSENPTLTSLAALSNTNVRVLKNLAMVGTNFGHVIELPQTIEKINTHTFGFATWHDSPNSRRNDTLAGWRILTDITLYLTGNRDSEWIFTLSPDEISDTSISSIFVNNKFLVYSIGEGKEIKEFRPTDHLVPSDAYHPAIVNYQTWALQQKEVPSWDYIKSRRPGYVLFEEDEWPSKNAFFYTDTNTLGTFVGVRAVNPNTIVWPFTSEAAIHPCIYAIHDFTDGSHTLTIAPLEQHGLIGQNPRDTESTMALANPPFRSGTTANSKKNPIGAIFYDWGDGTPLEYIETNSIMSHTYSEIGVYTQRIYGLIKTITATNGIPTFSIDGQNNNPYITEFGYNAMSGIWRFEDGWRTNCTKIAKDDKRIIFDLNLNSYYPQAASYSIAGIDLIKTPQYQEFDGNLYFYSSREQPIGAITLWPCAIDLHPPDIVIKKKNEKKDSTISTPCQMQDSTFYVGYLGGKTAYVYWDDIALSKPHQPIKVKAKDAGIAIALRGRGQGAFAKFDDGYIITPAKAIYIRDENDSADNYVDDVEGIEFTSSADSLLKDIPMGMFANCPNLSGGISLPPTITNIGENAFANTKVDDFGSIPKSCKSIGNGALASSKPVSVTITDSITSIAVANGNSAIGNIPYVLYQGISGNAKIYRSPVQVTFANNTKVEVLLNLNRLYSFSSLSDQFQKWHLSKDEEIVIDSIYRCKDGKINIHSKDGRINWE